MKITDIFQKLRIPGIDDLSPAERETFAKWQVILTKPDVTIEDMKTLLPKELERAYAELRNHKNSAQKDAYYKAYTSLLEFVAKAVTGPQKERENLKAFLKQKYQLD